MNVIKFATLVVFLSFVFSMQSNAFDIDGFHTGMTRDQIRAYAKNHGIEAWNFDENYIAIGKSSENKIDANFSFCGNDMVSYNHKIDFDIDYIPMLRLLLNKYGSPTVQTQSLPISGAGGVIEYGVDMSWDAGNDVIRLSFSPENRNGNGEVRFARDANISYFTKSKCYKKN